MKKEPKDSQSESQPNHLERLEKGGYQPVNEGYTPLDRRGYMPKAEGPIVVPELPKGGTAQSQKTETPKATE